METIQQSVTCHVNCYRRRNSIQTLLYKSKSKLPTHTSTLHTHHGLLIPSPSHSHLNGVEILRRRQLDFPESVGNGDDDHFFVHPFGMTLELLASSVPSISFYNSICILYYIDTCVYRERCLISCIYRPIHTVRVSI